LNFPGYARVDGNTGAGYTLDDGAQNIPLFWRAGSFLTIPHIATTPAGRLSYKTVPALTAF
jgi:hypothetical protein